MLPVLVIAVSCLNLFVRATDFYWMASGTTCEKGYGRRNLCIHYSNCLPNKYDGRLRGHTEICHFVDLRCVLCCVENVELEYIDNSYEIEKIPLLYYNPTKSEGGHHWDTSEEYWGSDQKTVGYNYDYWNYLNNFGYHFDVPHYDWIKQTPSHRGDYKQGDSIWPSRIENENDDPELPPYDVKPMNRGDDGYILTNDDGISASIITNSTEGLNIPKPFYRPTIENNTSWKKYREYFQANAGVGGYAISGGVPARPKQIPHIVLLGYGEPDNIAWGCGGSLISDQYILTAAHCTYSRFLNSSVKYVRLGEVDVRTKDLGERDFAVAEIIRHPQYSFLSHYHDIALLRLNGSITSFDDFIRPACLAITKNVENINFRISGWGATQFRGPRSNILRTTNVAHVPHSRCRTSYGVSKKLNRGIIDDIQICAGGGTNRRDTCDGDSGGPLQFTNTAYAAQGIPTCVELVGVTSFGRGCGGGAGVYTRVLPYVKWIESIVWPQ